MYHGLDACQINAGVIIGRESAGYECGGTLTNNTNIAGRLESMNVWYKGI